MQVLKALDIDFFDQICMCDSFAYPFSPLCTIHDSSPLYIVWQDTSLIK